MFPDPQAEYLVASLAVHRIAEEIPDRRKDAASSALVTARLHHLKVWRMEAMFEGTGVASQTENANPTTRNWLRRSSDLGRQLLQSLPPNMADLEVPSRPNIAQGPT
jgi:hypothetical protein